MTETAEAIETAEVEEKIEEVETEAIEKEEAIEPEEAKEEEKEEFVVSIGEETPPQEEKEAAPEWVKDLRKSQRETSKENRELKSRLEQYEKKAPVELGQKPTLEGCEYDEDKLSVAMDSWYEKKAQIDKDKVEEGEIAISQEKAWQTTLGSYEEKKTALKTKVKDYDDAEALVKDSLSTLYQGAILQGSKDPALLIFALGKNPKKLKELSSISDPAKFIWEVAIMESQLKTGSRRVATKPEKTVEGSGAGNAIDSTLAKLEADAEKSGDRTKVIKYKRDKKHKK